MLPFSLPHSLRSWIFFYFSTAFHPWSELLTQSQWFKRNFKVMLHNRLPWPTSYLCWHVVAALRPVNWLLSSTASRNCSQASFLFPRSGVFRGALVQRGFAWMDLHPPLAGTKAQRLAQKSFKSQISEDQKSISQHACPHNPSSPTEHAQRQHPGFWSDQMLYQNCC